MTGRMKSNRSGRCYICDGPWNDGSIIYYNEGRVGYFDCEECAILALERVPVRVDAQTTPQVTYVPPTANIAVDATETRYMNRPEDIRQVAIAKAHDENMAANARLVQAIDLQTAVCDDLRAELAKIAKCMQDDYLARRGVKV